MSDKKTQKPNKKGGKCKIKCRTCQFYDYDEDYCMERDIEYCTRQTNVNFAKCDDYLVRDKLIMF